MIPLALGVDGDRASPRPLCDPVHERVLHQRLQREGRYGGVQTFINMPMHGEPVRETHLFNLEVPPRDLEFLRERNLLRIPRSQGGSQQICQSNDGALGERRISTDECDDRIERVKKKVWIELGLQRTKLRVREVFAHAGGDKSLCLPVVVPPVGDLCPNDCAKDYHKNVTV